MNIQFPLLIDGGISNELEALGCNLNHKLWTAHLLHSDEEAIRKVHLNYMRAGAQCISSVSYQASIPGLIESGFSHEEAVCLLKKSISLVEEAREIYTNENKNHQDIYVVASIGPYGAYKADGSEYKGNYGLEYDDLMSFHRERYNIFQETNADIIAFETIPDSQEAKVIYDLSKESNKPCWISFSCKDDSHISDGTSIMDMASLFSDHPSFFAIGANCIPPDYIPGILKSLKKNMGHKRTIIYPNSGGYYDSTGKKWYANDEKFSLKNHVDEWLKLGMDVIGGCCKIGAQEISELRDHLTSR